MKKLRIGRPSPALIVAVIALFLALGGTGYAAFRLPKNSVGSKQLQPNSVTSSDVKDGSLRLQDFGAGQIPAGPQGAQGPAGKDGANGTNGTNGIDGIDGTDGTGGALGDVYRSSNTTSHNGSKAVQVTVPAGNYVASGTGWIEMVRTDSTYPTIEGESGCRMTSNNDSTGNTITYTTVPTHGFTSGVERGGTATVAGTAAFHLPSGGTISYTCTDDPFGTQTTPAVIAYKEFFLTATQVGTVH
jgi:hypothetical protein